MFESAELGHSVEKAVYEQELPALREALLNAQFDLGAARAFPVIILIAGLDGAGKSAVANTLNEWMDPRFIRTHGTSEPTQEELERPHMWRVWRQLPPKGRLAIFDGSWYHWPFWERVDGRIKDPRLDQALELACRFEQMLIDEGALVLKFWMHLSRDAQKKRLKKLEADPLTRWRVSDRDWDHFGKYESIRAIAERLLRRTSTAGAPWFLVEAADARYQKLTVGKILLEQLRGRLERVAAAPAPAPDPEPVPVQPEPVNALRALDLGQRLEKADYERELEKWQGRLNLLTRHKAFRKHSVIAVFEGVDAAGKGGAIRRITQAVDARLCHITPIAAPTEEERAQPYLWRFWRHLPGRGRLAIFDRSWYGRVLVERVEGFCREADWMRAYGEINDFEEQLDASGGIVVKFWLAISQEEQLRRFKEREESPFKRFKITPDDWRNRSKWESYEAAACAMLDRTSTGTAPWTLVASEDKRWGRVHVLKTLCQRIEERLENG